MTGEEFADRLERFSRAMDALQAELKKVATERDSLREEVAELSRRLDSAIGRDWRGIVYENDEGDA